MALEKKTFRTRAITAVVFAAVMMIGLLTNAYSFIVLFCIILLGCVYEFVKIMRIIDKRHYYKYVPLAIPYIIIPILMMLWLGITYNVYTAPPGTSELLYSPIFPLTIIFSIWVNDTMAYITGSFIGKTPFSKVSPKKTWEGTIGGALLCIIVISTLAYFLPQTREIATHHFIIISTLCAVFGSLGDLLESKIKRTANIKDSGSFMPGHGGFLDRFDSLLVATPVVWLYVVLFM